MLMYGRLIDMITNIGSGCFLFWICF